MTMTARARASSERAERPERSLGLALALRRAPGTRRAERLERPVGSAERRKRHRGQHVDDQAGSRKLPTQQTRGSQ